MAGEEKRLEITWYLQETDYFCGPAVAQMFLSFFGVKDPQGGWVPGAYVPQPQLWEEIKGNTGGSRPNEAPASAHGFPAQVCDECETSRGDPPIWECWDTTPEALQKTVTAQSGIALGSRYPITFDEGMNLIIGSLDRSPAIPPFATTSTINHWVLVNGYWRNDFASTEAPIEQVGNYQLNGVYFLDPQQTDEKERVRLIPIAEWRARFGLITCGPHIDTHPVVVGADELPQWLTIAVKVVLPLAVALMLWWWLRS